MLTRWLLKDPDHSAKSAGGRLHLNTHTPLTQRSRSGLSMPLSRHSVGTYQETTSHATRQGTLGHFRLSSLSHLLTDSDLKSGISVSELIYVLKYINKNAEAENEWSNLSQKSLQARKKLLPNKPLRMQGKLRLMDPGKIDSKTMWTFSNRKVQSKCLF